MELEEAEENYAQAKQQIGIWSSRGGGFARDQVEMWREILKANAWCQPGASSSGVVIHD